MNISGINTAILNIIYPVGSIIQNYGDDTNPGDRIPGTTWVRLNNRFLVNEGSSESSREFILGDLYNPTTGGEESVNLSVNNLPEHNHRITFYRKYKGGADPEINLFDWSSSKEWIQTVFGKASPDDFTKLTKIGTYDTSNTGDNNYRHNNMPPYIKVYGWYRIA